jgi:hypothetical protein
MLKQFSFRFFIFSALLFACVVFVFFGLDYRNKRAVKSIILKNNINSIVLGDSHIQNAIDDSKIFQFQNLSQFSEAPIYTYYKLEAILEQKTGIKKVYLGFSYHTLSSYFDDYTYGKFSKNIASKYFFILPYNIQWELIKRNPFTFKELLINSYSYGLKAFYIKVNELPFVGKYANEFKNTHSNIASMDKRIHQQFYENGKVRSYSELNILYLDKIIELCKSKGIDLFLLNAPLDDYYYSHIPSEFKEKYVQLIKERNLVVIDFKTCNFNDDSFIPDGDHLSSEGTLIASDYLKQFVENNKK